MSYKLTLGSMQAEITRLKEENATLKADAECMAESILWTPNAPEKTLTSHWNNCSCPACQTAKRYTKGE